MCRSLVLARVIAWDRSFPSRNLRLPLCSETIAINGTKSGQRESERRAVLAEAWGTAGHGRRTSCRRQRTVPPVPLRSNIQFSPVNRPFGQDFLIRRRPTNSFTSLVARMYLTRDGKLLLASAGNDGTLRLWDPAFSKPANEPLTGHGAPVLSVAFGVRPRLVTTARWDPATGKPASLSPGFSSVLG